MGVHLLGTLCCKLSWLADLNVSILQVFGTHPLLPYILVALWTDSFVSPIISNAIYILLMYFTYVYYICRLALVLPTRLPSHLQFSGV